MFIRKIIIFPIFLLSGCFSFSPIHQESKITVTPPPQTPPPPSPPQPIESFIGKDKKNIIKRFGSVKFIRYEWHHQLWQYKKEDCLMDVFLSHEEKEKLIVHYINIRPIKKNKDQCIEIFTKTY